MTAAALVTAAALPPRPVVRAALAGMVAPPSPPERGAVRLADGSVWLFSRAPIAGALVSASTAYHRSYEVAP